MSYKRVNLVQRSPEWLEWRRKYIMASDAPVIMGVSPYKKTLYDLALEKRGEGKKEKSPTPSMKKGIEMEEAILKKFEEYLNHAADIWESSLFQFSPEVIESTDPKFEGLGASLDGLSQDGKIAVEIKVANSQNHEIASQGKIPEGFYPQLQHQLAVLGHASMFYASYFIATRSLHIVKVERDDLYIERLLEKITQFRALLADPSLLDEAPPLPEGLTEAHLYEDISLYHSLESQIRELEKVKGQVKEKILGALQFQPFSGARCAVKKKTQPGRIRYSAISSLKELAVDWDAYRGAPITSWTFEVF